MATYDYKCKNCGHEMIDVVQSIHDDSLTECPECKTDGLYRVISTAGGFRIGGQGVDKPTSYMKVSTKHGSKA